MYMYTYVNVFCTCVSAKEDIKEIDLFECASEQLYKDTKCKRSNLQSERKESTIDFTCDCFLSPETLIIAKTDVQIKQ